MALVFKQQQQVVCVAVLIMCMAVTAPFITRAAITCGQVTSSLSPCINYLKTGGSVPAPCCNGVRSLNSAAATTPDRQAACKCIQEAASRIPGINPNLASGLPGQCGVNIPYKISPSTNCNSVK